MSGVADAFDGASLEVELWLIGGFGFLNGLATMFREIISLKNYSF